MKIKLSILPQDIAIESPIESRLPSTRRATVVALLVEGKRDSIGDSIAIL
jgi:hypothetical protein